MIRSMYSGISGMKNQQVKMDTIGNNIANLSSTAFKGSRVTFKDALTQTIQSASGPTFAVGGSNPRQVGLGMAVSSVDKDMRQGTLQPTGRATDIAVQGSGYFMVSNGAEIYYTRDGSFTLDRFGDLVTAEGLRVIGTTDGKRGPINLPLEHDTVPPIKIRDGAGTKELLQIKLRGFDGGDNIKNIDIVNVPGTPGGVNPVAIDPATGIMTMNIAGYDSLTALEKAITTQLKRIQEMSTEDLGTAGKEKDKAISDNIIKKGIYGISVTGDYTEAQKPGITYEVMDESRPKDAVGAPIKTGFYTEKVQLGSFGIGKDGSIKGVYGEDVFDVARLETSKFVNESGLEAVGSNLYRGTANSGEATRGYPGDIGFGTSEQGFLEMSNVDLANEFTDMIVTSRSYQANSKTIQTSDEMLQELLNLKR